MRKWRTLWADHLLSQFRNIRFLQRINIDPIKSQACPIDDDIFADSLEDLFSSDDGSILSSMDYALLSEIPEFSMDELEYSLRKLSNLKCADENGIVAEMIK